MVDGEGVRGRWVVDGEGVIKRREVGGLEGGGWWMVRGL